LEHGRVHAAQLLGGGGVGLGQDSVVQAGQRNVGAADGDRAVGRLQGQGAADARFGGVDRADVVGHGQTVPAEALDGELGADEVAGEGGDGIAVVAGVGEGCLPQRQVLAGGVVAVGLAVEGVQGAQAQVGGILGGGGVAEHLDVVLLQQGAAHGDV